MTGLIAFFDILGYQSFLENNKEVPSARKVLELITATPPLVKKLSLEFDFSRSHFSAELKDTALAVEHLIFSDTILLYIQYPPTASESWRNAALATISFFSGVLFSKMFVEGLPMRGAIVEGDFLFQDMCFAGHAIVEAYKLCHSLDFSGLVFHQHLDQPLRTAFHSKNFDKSFVVYLSPLRGGREEKLLHFNWTGYLKKHKSAFLSDIETFVHKAFWAHGKDCPISVDAKIANTVKLCRRFALEFEAST